MYPAPVLRLKLRYEKRLSKKTQAYLPRTFFSF